MINSNTVLVLGAGASAPFGFPLGQGLKDLVCRKILQQPGSVQLLATLGFKTDIISRFRTALENSGRSTVDAFLEYREDFLEIGKTAIAATLLPYETTARLFRDWIVRRANPEITREGNWYDLLFGVLSDGIPFEEFNKHKLSIITFNYDRSIEHYLFTSLKNSYNKPDKECGEKLRKIEIIHVHGSLGPLGWQSRPAGLPSVPYDSGTDPKVVKLAAQNIKIIHESVADTPEFTQARNILLNSTRVLFLGFGYHPTNLRRLRIETLKTKYLNVKGTSVGLSHERKEIFFGLIPPLQSVKDSTLFPEDVYTFLHEHVSFSEL